MKLKPANFDDLPEPERGIARLACCHKHDLFDNGRRAHTTLASMRRQPRYKDYDLDEIKDAVWRLNTGTHHPVWEAWECPECGQAHLGQERAFSCCAETDFEEEREY